MTSQTLVGPGLTQAEVDDRIARGQANHAPDANARSLGDIVRTNTFTWFNGLIGSLWVLMLVVAPWQDALFGFIILANTGIGIVQEYRAARTLAALSVIGAARPVVRRADGDRSVAAADIVLDDLVVLRTGDQFVVDGEILVSDGLEIDESLLTGEADPVDKAVGDTAMSGSFVVAGHGLYRATRVGADSFAAGLTQEAKKFSLTNSELRDSIMRFIRFVSWFLVPVGLLLVVSQLRADIPVKDAVRGAIAGVVTMVPEGLVLLTSIAMAVAVVRLARKRTLVQEMPAVEVLARVDVVCVDKTGTLTAPGMAVRDVVVLDPDAPVAAALGALGASELQPNPTLQAVADGFTRPADWTVLDTVAFSSARKWSAATFADHGSWVLGAPEFLLPDGTASRRQADDLAAGGARVLLLARCSGDAAPSADAGTGPLAPAALVVIDQRLRPDAADTVRYFLDQGVQVKVISGDHPTTAAAIAAQAGVPGAADPVDARGLPTDLAELADVVARHSVFGRVSPSQKRQLVDALHHNGSTVAMTGDGVNDVLALKAADLGIAMGSGAGATRAVAQIVLLDDQFTVMPSVVAEGRRVLGNIERVSDVFLTKSVYATIVSFMTGVFAVAFPFLPRHLSLVSALTIGIPAFFLALMPNAERFRPGFFRRVMIFAIPAGVITAAASFAAYLVATWATYDGSAAAKVDATTALFIVSLAVLIESARPLNALRLAIVAAMAGCYVAVLVVPPLSRFFALELQADADRLWAVGIGLLGAALVIVAGRLSDRWRRT
ncbi:MAG: HAD family hydrolase [Actinomycetota bacterium]|nr:MAG: HAD family hydrolase [Actinomycetota bacterium]